MNFMFGNQEMHKGDKGVEERRAIVKFLCTERSGVDIKESPGLLGAMRFFLTATRLKNIFVNFYTHGVAKPNYIAFWKI